MFTFRTSITCAVMVFIFALAALLTAIQVRVLHLATHEAASSYMDATSSKVVARLQTQIAGVVSLVHVLATSSSVTSSDEVTETSTALPLFKTALLELPQMDSIYVGFENGAWLQVRLLSELNDRQRERLRATMVGADVAINLVRPTESGALPMRRIFEDRQGDKVGQLDLWQYGYDPRRRFWYVNTMAADRPIISSPYLAFTIGAPVITVSAPLQGKVHGVLAADLKLDNFSDFVQAQRPGEHGTVLIFDSTGSLIAHPDFAQFIGRALTHPDSHLPNISEINSGVAAAVWQRWRSGDRYEGDIRDDQGRNYLFRLVKIPLGEHDNARILLLADSEDFVQSVRKLQLTGLILAISAGGAFVPLIWIFGGRVSRSLKTITRQAAKLQKLATPDTSPVTSYFKEVNELGSTVNLAQRAIWSFARFVPKEIVRRVIDNSISTELGGVRQEITVVFTDVQDFTTIAESADPDILMHQTSRYFSALTEAFLAEDGTVDKFIGDAMMVFWNAPNSQPDHVERACRAVLAGKAAGEKLNAQFESEGLKPFFTRFGIHVGEAVVGNLGSMERMNYTALGSTVNLASRIEGMNKRFGTAILVSEEVRSRVAHRFRFRIVDSVLAKGMTKKTLLFELIEATDKDNFVDAPTARQIGIAPDGPPVDPSRVRIE
jgi:adenylate cyclase